MAEDISKTQMIKAYLTNGSRPSLGNILTILGMVGGLFTVWGTLSADNATTKQRVQTIEERQKEDREVIRRDQREIKQDVKQVASDVQKILLQLQVMDAQRRSQR